jgi:hypothetical protein
MSLYAAASESQRTPVVRVCRGSGDNLQPAGEAQTCWPFYHLLVVGGHVDRVHTVHRAASVGPHSARGAYAHADCPPIWRVRTSLNKRALSGAEGTFGRHAGTRST